MLDGLVQQWLIGDHTLTFDAARRAQNGLWRGVVDPDRQFVRRESTENNRVHRTNSGAGQHGIQRFGYHRHVDHNAVTLGDTSGSQHTSQSRDPVLEFGKGNCDFAVCDRTVMDDRCLIATPGLYVTVHRVVTGVGFGIREPSEQRCSAVIQNLLWFFRPIDVFCRLGPEGFGVFLPTGVSVCVLSHSFLLLDARLRTTQPLISERVDPSMALPSVDARHALQHEVAQTLYLAA